MRRPIRRHPYARRLSVNQHHLRQTREMSLRGVLVYCPWSQGALNADRYPDDMVCLIWSRAFVDAGCGTRGAEVGRISAAAGRLNLRPRPPNQPARHEQAARVWSVAPSVKLLLSAPQRHLLVTEVRSTMVPRRKPRRRGAQPSEWITASAEKGRWCACGEVRCAARG